MSEDEVKLPDNLIFFDGVCVLCHGWTRLLLSRSIRRRSLESGTVFYFSILQGKLAKQVLPREYTTPPFKSVIYVKQGAIFSESDAILISLKDCYPWIRWIFCIFLILPKVIRDRFYWLISASRYKLFGRYEQCPLPKQEEKEFFI